MKLFKKHRSLQAMFGALLIAMLVAACGNSGANTGNPGNTNTQQANGKGCKKVGVLLPETASSERWDKKDRPLLEEKLKALGVEVMISNAEGNADTQQTQADTALTKGACILVVAPFDADKAGAIVSKAASQGVPVVAYDRLIQSDDLNYYVSFDGVRVGEVQGQYIVDHYKEYVKGDNKNLVMINGGETDNNAKLFYKGAMNKLQPLIDKGELKKVYDQFTPEWNNDTARTEMDGALTQSQDNVQIAYVANDGMANSVIAALKAKKLNGKVLVTGQDATAAGIQNILLGDQMMTVYKPVVQEAQATADIVKALIDGTDPKTVTKGTIEKTASGKEIPSVLLEPIAIDKSNIKRVLDDKYLTKEEVCQNVPKGTGGIC
uniref:Sugar ABC transporter substrate-binding protein n=1 Tax=Thermosporothrix sp. COM3 TaxID=2490863 RepID=A0A455SJ76_9CHLR|nr:sugar ABC transporter substrate-binding protein [Thermosporothrix sp. COM3]